jgi:hypothetical protein
VVKSWISHTVVCCWAGSEWSKPHRVQGSLSSLHPMHISVLCMLPPFSDVVGGYPEAWTFAASVCTNWKPFGASENLPGS